MRTREEIITELINPCESKSKDHYEVFRSYNIHNTASSVQRLMTTAMSTYAVEVALHIAQHYKYHSDMEKFSLHNFDGNYYSVEEIIGRG